MPTATITAMEPLVINGETCRDWSKSSELEWLETNGTGGFAMGTVSGANTRRYHSLLTASLRPPVERFVMLSRLEEEVLCDGESANLGACQYPGIVTPSGFRMLSEFQQHPFPTWTYQTGCTQIEKRLFLIHGEQTAVIQYRSSMGCRLRIRPFLAFRDYHSTQHANGEWNRTVSLGAGVVTVRPYEALPALHLHHNSADFVEVAHWYRNNEYRKEMDRGLDYQEDLYSPGWFDFELKAGEEAFIAATIENLGTVCSRDVSQWEERERERRTSLINTGLINTGLINTGLINTGLINTGSPDLWNRLETAADQFVVRRHDGSPTIIAGYPWFTDWGRDTMISLPGLLISRGKLDDARDIMEGFLNHLHQGVIPNRFADAGSHPEYNTADATLWLFQAAWAYQHGGGSEQFIRDRVYPRAKEIIDWHQKGTHYGIRVDPEDGLLSAGTPATQLTWMDAKVGDWVVTPRHGKPVEINALWYNAMRITTSWAHRFGGADYAAELENAAQLAASSFAAKFWNPAAGCLYDCLLPSGPDDRIRPNQIFAISLPFPLMSADQQQSILRVVEERLLTPVGLRTLDPAHPEYRGRYEGGPLQRDGAYHQGTVWPWLLGPYISAKLQAFGSSAQQLRECHEILQPLEAEFQRCCLGSLAEIYDGDAPHHPVGAAAQAWSVAEALRVLAVLTPRNASLTN
ncbi:MAG: glycogen debranching enzyme N-terminal domain-containing protein [Bryobacterales bacterium]|nr:glycogen debranching enzyme N-terminal domain-containing protein [Bryobacterales bacterium]